MNKSRLESIIGVCDITRVYRGGWTIKHYDSVD